MGGLGGLILRLGTVGVGVAGEGAGDGGFDAGTFWLLGTVFGCILMLLVRVCTVERVWVVGACNIIHVLIREPGTCSRYSDYTTGRMTKESWFDSWQENDIFLFSKISRLTLEPNEPPIL